VSLLCGLVASVLTVLSTPLGPLGRVGVVVVSLTLLVVVTYFVAADQDEQRYVRHNLRRLGALRSAHGRS
jgi:hypothetical protein